MAKYVESIQHVSSKIFKYSHTCKMPMEYMDTRNKTREASLLIFLFFFLHKQLNCPYTCALLRELIATFERKVHYSRMQVVHSHVQCESHLCVLACNASHSHVRVTCVHMCVCVFKHSHVHSHGTHMRLACAFMFLMSGTVLCTVHTHTHTYTHTFHSEYALYRTFIQKIGIPECRYRDPNRNSFNEIIRPIDNLGNPNVRLLYSPGYLRNQRWADQATAC